MCDAFWGGASIDFNGSVLHYFHPWMHTRIRVVGIVACSFALPLSFSAVLETHVHAEKGIDWFCSRAEGLLFPAGVAIPLVTEGNNRHSGRISSLWGCAVSAMVADLRFTRNAFRHFSPTASILLPSRFRFASASLNVRLCRVLFRTSGTYVPPWLIAEIVLLEKLRYFSFRKIRCIEIVAYDLRGVSSPSSSDHGRTYHVS